MSAPAIERVEEMRLTPALDGEIAALIEAAFGSIDYGGRSFYPNRHHARLLLRVDGALVGHAALAFRAIRIGDAVRDAIGLAEDGVHPDHRRQGHASALVAAAIAEARRTTAAFVLLFGTERLYAAAGLAHVRNPVTFTRTADVRTGETERTTDHALMVLPLGDAEWDPEAPVDLAGWPF